jgi:hypothetical protein
LVAGDCDFDGIAAAFDNGDIPDGDSLYHILKDYDCPVLSYSGFARGRKRLIDGGVPNPHFGVTTGAKRVTEIIPGVSVRQHMAFSGHSVCETCSFINAKLAEAQSREDRAYWIAQKGAHNLDVKKDRVKELFPERLAMIFQRNQGHATFFMEQRDGISVIISLATFSQKKPPSACTISNVTAL